MQKKRNRSYGAQILCGAVFSAVVIAAVLFFGRSGSSAVQAFSPAAEDVLQSLEVNDASSIDVFLSERAESRYEEEQQSLFLQAAQEGFEEDGWHSTQEKELGNGSQNVWAQFQDYVLLGDSRAVGFSYYGFLSDARVIADGGNTIRDVETHKGEIEALAPAYVIFCYGLNDAGIGYWMDGESYAEEFMEIIEDLRADLPNTKFVVSSVLPSTDYALALNPGWKRIELFNAALTVTCPQHNVVFVNNDGIAAQYMDTLWDEDGVHLQPEFYPYWANNLLQGMRLARNLANAAGPAAEEPATAAGADGT